MPGLTQNFQQATAAIMPDLMWDDITKVNDPILDALPLGYLNADKVKWDQFEDSYGLIPLRGVDHAPDTVQMPGYRSFQFDPGYYGANTQLRESELTSERNPNSVNDPLNVGDRLGVLFNHYSTMIVSTFRKVSADLLRTGSVTLTGNEGQVFQYGVPGYRTASPGVGWAASPTTATPINDMLGWQALYQKGTSSSFGADSMILMNSNTIADLFATTDVKSTYKGTYGSTLIGLDGKGNLNGLNEILQGFGLPKIVRYDLGYYGSLTDVSGGTTQLPTFANWNYIIPNKSFIWIGKRPGGQKLGQFQLTRHAGMIEEPGTAGYPEVTGVANQGAAEIASGIYTRVHYVNRQPHHYEVEVGFNGSPVLWYPSSAIGGSYS